MEGVKPIRWSPLHPEDPSSLNLRDYALVVLNTRIEAKPSIVAKAWNEANYRVTVDGGTDRWLTYLDSSGASVDKRFPDMISGDFDSIQPETMEMCKAAGCLVVETPDQNYTDFEKSLQSLVKAFSSIVVLCEFSGRVDQSMSILNSLRLGSDLPGRPALYALSSESLTWHLCRGEHVIQIPKVLREKQRWCAVLPFEPKENTVTTTGLKWNLSGHTIKFGGLISSSNTFDGSEFVTIITDAELLWTMGF